MEANMNSIDRRDFCKRFGLLVGVGLSSNLPVVSFAEEKNLFEAKVAITGAKSNIGYAEFFIGEKLGYFAKEGIRQEIIDFKGGGDTIRAITTGSCHYTWSSITAAAIAFEKGEPLKLIGSGFGTVAIGWLTRYDSSIKSLKDIKGKKIGFSVPGSNSNFFALKALKAAGLTTEDFMEKHPNILHGFVKAFLKTCDFIINNPEKSGEMIAEIMGIDKELGIMSIKNVPQKAWTLQFTEPMLKNIEEGLLEMKLIKKPVEWKKLIDQRFLPQHMRIKLP